MASAIVTGATGILGREIVGRLGHDSKQWKTVYAMSRSKKDEYPSNVKHSFIDLTGSADEMAKNLQGIEAEYVFFAAYLQKDTDQENWDVNGDMLQNFLSALTKTGAAKKIKRILLVTGAKQYGVHLGVPKNPMEESDPWQRDQSFPPNFYYRQQDVLHAFCEEHSHISWTVTYPNDVIGFAKGNFMNLATSVGIYAAIAKELGQDLEFPGSEAFYTKFDSFTSAKLHAEFCEWAVKEPKAANQAFNVVNGDVESWQNLWPKLARRFGLKVKADQFTSKSQLASETELFEKPPLSLVEERSGLKGKISPSKVEQRIDLTKWSQQEEVKNAWNRLAEREGLESDAFDKATWAFLGFVLGRSYDLVISMSKAREMGWTGYTDTWLSLSDVFRELESQKILPRTH
ncbi:nad dependent epimerase dehydratase family protein [Colletotrichum truncatum]|uniref:Nad dependent epimerase dehydratase family protein n=1 Tax=Colletotrichum truncatum TaxID=5467 RepID=A0ACC3YU17_COLTU|nr:nad dependent epimerase dehydratase family protein [Colletotrichum truncatum]XP_036587695.1 nad dependent epimerase dehydratase family protein [Colletotrichum truncatum]KAF6780672.1 nad dependent epimerase dehydratase family protein [Colletotrichum truncatum]KAF6798637.1 nad dependent epimerase dehydratase family protein [Colletotrichum truncatum]